LVFSLGIGNLRHQKRTFIKSAKTNRAYVHFLDAL
jgi:hypothetical protein